MRLLSCSVLALGIIGCGKGDDESNEGGQSGAPASCIADAEVCAAYSSDWSSGEADEHCAELGGTEGTCPGDEVGLCALEDGLKYYLYEMPKLEARDYCDWFGGTWTDAE